MKLSKVGSLSLNQTPVYGDIMFDINEASATLAANAKELKSIQKELKPLLKDRDKLDGQIADLTAKAQSLAGIDVETDVKPQPKRRRKSKVKADNGEATQKRGRATSETGETRREIMLRTMPGPDADPISKDRIVELLEAEGYKSASEDAKIGVGQELNNMSKSNLVTNKHGERGEWRLTKIGENSRDKIAREKAEADAEATAEKTEADSADETVEA